MKRGTIINCHLTGSVTGNFPKSLTNESYISGPSWLKDDTLPDSFLAKSKRRKLTDLLLLEVGFKLVFKKEQLNNFRLTEDFGLVLHMPLKFWVCFSAVSKFFILACLPLKTSSG